MNIKYILFDLDATLLPMNQDEFIKEYFKSLIKFLASKGYEPKKLHNAIWNSIMSVVMNDGSCTNEERFWQEMTNNYNENVRASESLYNEYYLKYFDQNKSVCGYNESSNLVIKEAKKKGLKVVLATNPVFPRIATEHRIEWAGVDKNDFIHITTYENSCYCKPNTKYYEEILKKIGANANECLMVGNDATEDMIASMIGMKVFLLTDCLINTKNVDISKYPNGGFNELLEYINNLD